jgi:hypothetical protein
MHISDDRYSRERRCLDLALRFLRHEARTQTMRAGPVRQTTGSSGRSSVQVTQYLTVHPILRLLRMQSWNGQSSSALSGTRSGTQPSIPVARWR